MDLLKMIKKQVSSFPAEEQNLGLRSVITHIERAELFLEKGNGEKDDNFFTDVIYRTNQAFERALKEAYSVLNDSASESKRLTPYEIEQYFINNKVLKDRVLEQFTNYRVKWRNPSTHDHKLFFDGSEALLAIMSISVFVHILLKEMIETIAYKIEKEKHHKDIKDIQSYNKKPLEDKVTELLIMFSDDILSKNTYETESELLGALHAFMSSIDPTLIIRREKILGKEEKKYIADFLIEEGLKQVVLEIKNYKYKKHYRIAIDNVMRFLALSGISNGILFIPSTEKGGAMIADKKELSIGKQTIKLTVVIPK